MSHGINKVHSYAASYHPRAAPLHCLDTTGRCLYPTENAPNCLHIKNLQLTRALKSLGYTLSCGIPFCPSLQASICSPKFLLPWKVPYLVIITY